MRKFYFVIISFVLMLSGCNRDTVVDPTSNPVTPKLKIGLYVLCEGSGVNTAKLSFYDLDSVFYENIFSPGSLGGYPDGMIYDGKDILITEQGSWGGNGKIYRIDSSGKVLKSNIIGINPYSLCVADNKIYVTNGPANNVSVLDFNSLSELKTINVGVYPQEILSYNDKVFVCNTYSFGGPSDSTVFVIDALNDVVVDTIVLQTSPSSIALSRDKKLLIGCFNANGKIFKVDPVTFVKLDSFSVAGGFEKDISIDKNSDDIFFINYLNEVAKLNLVTRNSETVIQNPNPSVNKFYGYIFDSKRRNHFVANALNFAVRGYVQKFDIFGSFPPVSFQTGIAPRRFLLLDN